MVFLHANGFNARAYRTILAPLAATCASSRPTSAAMAPPTLATDRPRTSWLDLKDDLLAFLDAMEIERVALAGHSMGGTASLLAAAEAPQRVRALALLDPVIRPSGQRRSPPEQVWRLAAWSQGALKRRRDFPSRAAAVESYRGRGAFRTWTEAQLVDYVDAGFRTSRTARSSSPARRSGRSPTTSTRTTTAGRAFEALALPDPHPAGRTRVAGPDRRGPGAARRRPAASASTPSPDTTHFLPMERPELVRAAILEAVAAP